MKRLKYLHPGVIEPDRAPARCGIEAGAHDFLDLFATYWHSTCASRASIRSALRMQRSAQMENPATNAAGLPAPGPGFNDVSLIMPRIGISS